MTLLITVLAAVFSTLIWYSSAKARDLKVGVLCWMFWGASLMWLVDAIFEYVEDGANYFTPAVNDMINDTFLGFSVIALACVIWIVYLMVKDPAGVVREKLAKK